MASIEEIASALHAIAKPGMKPKALRTAIRQKYPDVTKKEVVRAAFYALTEPSPAQHGAHDELHNFALAERIAEDNADEVLRVSKLKKKKKHAADSDGKTPAH